MLMDLDTDRIIRIFHANGIKMSLKKAFELANILYTVHLEAMNEQSTASYKTGKEVGSRENDRNYEMGYNDGVAAGKRSANYIAEGNHVSELIQATLWVEDNVSFGNLDQKIRCIKEVRHRFSTLGLRDCKTIIDNATGNGIGLRF